QRIAALRLLNVRTAMILFRKPHLASSVVSRAGLCFGFFFRFSAVAPSVRDSLTESWYPTRSDHRLSSERKGRLAAGWRSLGKSTRDIRRYKVRPGEAAA